MNRTLDEALDALGRLHFEMGGPLLDQILALEDSLRKERVRRVRMLDLEERRRQHTAFTCPTCQKR